MFYSKFLRPTAILLFAAGISGCSSGDVALNPGHYTPATAAPVSPTTSPTIKPTTKPTTVPTTAPTTKPTTVPTTTPTSTPAPTPKPTATPVPSAIVFDPAYVSFPASPNSCPASYNVQQFSVSEAGYTGPFNATNNNRTNYTVTPASGVGPFTITDITPSVVKSGSVTLTDSHGNRATLMIDTNLVCLP